MHEYKYYTQDAIVKDEHPDLFKHFGAVFNTTHETIEKKVQAFVDCFSNTVIPRLKGTYADQEVEGKEKIAEYPREKGAQLCGLELEAIVEVEAENGKLKHYFAKYAFINKEGTPSTTFGKFDVVVENGEERISRLQSYPANADNIPFTAEMEEAFSAMPR